MNRKSTRNHFS